MKKEERGKETCSGLKFKIFVILTPNSDVQSLCDVILLLQLRARMLYVLIRSPGHDVL
jgi:hypothetical protein